MKEGTLEAILSFLMLLIGMAAGWYAIQKNDVSFSLLCTAALMESHRMMDHRKG